MPTRTVPTRAKSRPDLSRYLAKRDLAASGEPDAGSAGRESAREIRRYVIQKHDATRLHYDFRLEMDGALRSWAVPKGLPEKAGERVLAVEVEDHPLDYGSFEGVIPAGNYGAGAVMLWDRGSYTVAEGTPESAYREGKIHLALSGEKCVGEWTLVRMKGKPGDARKNWLMIRNSGPMHRTPLKGAARERSVSSGRTLDEIAAGKPKRRQAPRTKKTPPRVKKKPRAGGPSRTASRRRSSPR